MQIGILEQKIIVELQKNGRASFTELAKKFSVSPSTIRRKLEWLRNEGVVTITSLPEPQKVGYDTVVMMGISINLRDADDIVSELGKDHCNHLIATTTGRFDILVWSWFRNTRELSDYLANRISQIPGIQKCETMLFLDMKKRTFGWMQDLEAD